MSMFSTAMPSRSATICAGTSFRSPSALCEPVNTHAARRITRTVPASNNPAPSAPGDVRRRNAARFDVRRIAEPAQPAPIRRLGFSLRKAGDIGGLHCFVERCLVVARVVQQRDRRLVRERADEVAPANLVLGETKLHGGLVHETLDDVRRFAARRRDTHPPEGVCNTAVTSQKIAGVVYCPASSVA
jgi:hypothetical protein